MQKEFREALSRQEGVASGNRSSQSAAVHPQLRRLAGVPIRSEGTRATGIAVTRERQKRSKSGWVSEGQHGVQSAKGERIGECGAQIRRLSRRDDDVDSQAGSSSVKLAVAESRVMERHDGREGFQCAGRAERVAVNGLGGTHGRCGRARQSEASARDSATSLAGVPVPCALTYRSARAEPGVVERHADGGGSSRGRRLREVVGVGRHAEAADFASTVAPRAMACSSGSRISTAPPSPRIMPLRSRENGGRCRSPSRAWLPRRARSRMSGLRFAGDGRRESVATIRRLAMA